MVSKSDGPSREEQELVRLASRGVFEALEYLCHRYVNIVSLWVVLQAHPKSPQTVGRIMEEVWHDVLGTFVAGCHTEMFARTLCVVASKACGLATARPDRVEQTPYPAESLCILDNVLKLPDNLRLAALVHLLGVEEEKLLPNFLGISSQDFAIIKERSMRIWHENKSPGHLSNIDKAGLISLCYPQAQLDALLAQWRSKLVGRWQLLARFWANYSGWCFVVVVLAYLFTVFHLPPALLYAFRPLFLGIVLCLPLVWVAMQVVAYIDYRMAQQQWRTVSKSLHDFSFDRIEGEK